jgi:hypothetical protein
MRALTHTGDLRLRNLEAPVTKFTQRIVLGRPTLEKAGGHKVCVAIEGGAIPHDLHAGSFVMDVLSPERVDVAEAAEHLIRTWSLALEDRCKADPGGTHCSPQLVHDYVTISAESGIDAEHISTLLAENLGWQALTRRLLDFLCVQYDWRINLLDYANETAAEWFQNHFGCWLARRIPKSCEYVTRFGNIVLLGAQHASYVFESPIAQFTLPPECGLNVRLVAPLRLRTKLFTERHKCNFQDAECQVRKQDAADAGIVRRWFRRNIIDPELYDVIINLEHTTSAAAVDLILGDYLMRFVPMQVACAFRVGEDRESHRL